MHAFHAGIGIAAILVAIGGLLALIAIRNPRRSVRCRECAGGQLAGEPLDAAQPRPAVATPLRPTPAGTAQSLHPGHIRDLSRDDLAVS